MYPNLYFFLKEAFNADAGNWTKYINSFGFFVAIAFLAAAYVLTKELQRKEKEGLLHPTEEKRKVGEKATPMELFSNAFFGFVVGYKILGIFLNKANISPQEYIFSSHGSWAGGIALALLFGGLKFWEKYKVALPKPEERTIRVWPHERVGDIVILAAVFGFLGAKLFDNLENWDRFVTDPIGNLFSPSGLTFYGGLICAAIAILWTTGKKGIHWKHLTDATAPGLMLAYAIGRIGCQVAGDGDWGIYNSAYTTTLDGKVALAKEGDFAKALSTHADHFSRHFENLQQVPHMAVKAPAFLPDWLVAFPYTHNVNEDGIQLANCTGNYCTTLPVPVFPTPFYEVVMCLILFGVLWSVRKKIKIPGRLFALYLVLNGIERFFIEKIRVNSTYNIMGFHPTQAELISTGLIIGGGSLWYYLGKKGNSK